MRRKVTERQINECLARKISDGATPPEVLQIANEFERDSEGKGDFVASELLASARDEFCHTFEPSTDTLTDWITS